MIPKEINYCWFGGKPLPKLAKKCIASWQKFLPDYKIKRWDETNFNINACAYVQEAYQTKKWAFVSDYARFAILYKYGGLYFDTDVEIISPLDDILSKGAFMGLECDFNSKKRVNPGLGLAVAPGLGLYKELLEAYHGRHFLNEDGTLDETTIVEYTTEILQKHGLQNKPGIQQVAGITIYPKEYFNPIDHTTGKLIITPNTYTIHHYMASWCTPASRKRGKIYQFLARYFGKKIADKIRKFWRKIK